MDLETTGFSPKSNHRIAEVAVVHVDRSGRITDRWETLINPGRDLGPQKVHRISASDIRHAPSFDDASGELMARLKGRALVAHNLNFDAPFLHHEFMRSGYETHISPSRGLCTMQLAGTLLPGAGRSLSAVCDALGIDLVNGHSAGADAFATAELLGRYIEMSNDHPVWNQWIEFGARLRWPEFVRRPLTPAFRTPASSQAKHFLDRIVDRLPPYEGPENCTAYLAQLDAALIDRFLSGSESDALVEIARELNIGQQQAMTLHSEYVGTLAAEAWADGVVTEAEAADLYRVAVLLRVDRAVVEEGIATRPEVTSSMATSSARTLERGDLIVLTGDMSRPRPEIEDDLRRAGYVPHYGVTKKVKLVVAADPDSLSGKAKKARDYGIPVVNEAYISQLI